ncbi:MAG: helix-turn-helix transcriptional regulator [Alphaproteobacteria bacterium]|nr:helix-turn-helix transcriptional regulator [Alphaproteobacteria bacterium]
MKDSFLENWQVQIKKGYLDLCILQLLYRHEKLYGLKFLELLERENIKVKDGTLYPLLSRLEDEEMIESSWDLKNVKGHPRKFYTLTKNGKKQRNQMEKIFQEMLGISIKLKG